MSRFKFRAWVDGAMLHSEDNLSDFFGDSSPVCGYGFSEIGEGVILNQWTGLKDIDGKDIYEDDVVTWGTNEIAIVVFEAPEFLRQIVGNPSPSYPFKQHHEYRVIGNVYEKPELI